MNLNIFKLFSFEVVLMEYTSQVFLDISRILLFWNLSGFLCVVFRRKRKRKRLNRVNEEIRKSRREKEEEAATNLRVSAFIGNLTAF